MQELILDIDTKFPDIKTNESLKYLGFENIFYTKERDNQIKKKKKISFANH